LQQNFEFGCPVTPTQAQSNLQHALPKMLITFNRFLVAVLETLGTVATLQHEPFTGCCLSTHEPGMSDVSTSDQHVLVPAPVAT